MAPEAELTCASVWTRVLLGAGSAGGGKCGEGHETVQERWQGAHRSLRRHHPSAAAHHRRAGRKAVEGPARRVGGVPPPGWQPMSPDVIGREVEGRARPKAGVVKLVDTPDLGSGGFG